MRTPVDDRDRGAAHRRVRSTPQVVNLRIRSARTTTGQAAETTRSRQGTCRAQPSDMYNADAIVNMNSEQLVTVTDRLLLGRGRRPAPRSSMLPPALAPRMAAAAAQPRAARRWRAPFIAATLAVPFCVAFGLAALL